MVVGRALRATGCAQCRVSILRSFASFEKFPVRARHTLTSASSTHHRPYARHTSNFAHGSHQGGIVGGTLQNEQQDVSEDGEGEVDAVESPTEAHDLPWYLKLNNPKKEPQPLSERQRIPEIPGNSPPLLQPLMQHISVDLGLDDLTLLDLRKLDPPPALGANLMMLLATTRSERHLHVSADRLCRWLRSNYKLRPDADGLLGRNELKLKLKRKMRRAKLMGDPTADNQDDGVRTGWVCVDVGVVDAAEGDHAAVQVPDFVGFGRRTDGVRIVVQMLTEEKREEIDLEKLWAGILKRGLEAGLEVGGKEAESGFATTTADQPTVYNEVRKPSHSHQGAFTQARRFHTTARHMASELNDNSPEQSLFYNHAPLTSSPSIPIPLADDLHLHLSYALKSEKYEALLTIIRPFTSRIPGFEENDWRAFLLRELRLHLEHMEPKAALERLGKGYDDYDSTPFLAGLHGLISPFSFQADFEARFWLQCFARELGNARSYPLLGLQRLLYEAQLSGVRISTTAYKRLLFSILCPTTKVETYRGPTNETVNVAMKVLKAMHDQGINILTEDILVLLQEASYQTPPKINHEELHSSPGSLHFPSLSPLPIQRRLHVLMEKVDLPPFGEDSRLRLLNFHALQHHWREFWDVWRMGPRLALPHSEAMYRYMFDAVAQTKNQSACCTALRTWIPEMDRESTPVEITWVLVEAIMKCVQVADPDVLKTYYHTPDANGEWVALWRRCVLKLEEVEMRQEETNAC